MSRPSLNLRDPELAQILADRSLVISAGAGSGKTFTLVSLVLGFLGRGGKAPEVLATTFGREAAADLRSRILRPLDQMASWNSDTWSTALAALKKDFQTWDALFDSNILEARNEVSLAARLWASPEGWPLWTSSPSAAREHWVRTRREAELLRVSTVHGLALELLHQRGQEAGQLLEAGDPALLRLLRSAGRETLRLPAEHPDAPAARRLLAWCEGFQEDHDRWRLLASAFDAHLDALGTWRTSTSTAPHRERLLSEGQGLLSTYGDFVRQPSRAAGLNKDLTVKAYFTKYGLPKLQREPESEASMPSLLDALERLATRFLDDKGQLAKYYSDAFSEAMATLSEELPAHLEAWMTLLVERVFARYRDLKTERNLHSYGDLVREALGLLRSKPEAHPPALLLVDEYQDINPVQEAFLEALGAKRRILVGDPKQAIYGFRGGVPELLRAKLNQASTRDEAFRLPANHRSCAPVVELANCFVRDLVPRMDPSAADPDGEQSHDENIPAAPRLGLGAIPSAKKQGGDLPGASPWIVCLGQEAGWQACGFEGMDGPRKRALLLARRTGLPALRRSLQAAHIEPLVQGREGFWESPAVRLLMALLECVACPEARAPRLAVLRSPWVGAADPELLAFVREECTSSKIMEGMNWISELRNLSTQAMVASAVARPGLLELLAATAVHGALEPARARRNLDRFLGWIPGLPASPSLAWSRLNQMRVSEDPGDAPAEDAAADLVVQTIHGAKGLEYDDVILPMLADRVKGVPKGTVRQRPGRPGELWLGWKLGKAAGPALRELKGEEERRAFREGLNLLYVGLTRAKGRMALLQQWSPGKDGGTEAPPGTQSRQKDGKVIHWQHVATDLAASCTPLHHLGEVPSLPLKALPGTHTSLLPPSTLAPPITFKSSPSEVTSSAERVRRGSQIHALIREVLVRHRESPEYARAHLKAHPLMLHWPQAESIVEDLLGELETRQWLILPRRTEFELAGAGKSGGMGRADLVIWSPLREAPKSIHLVDFKLSSTFSESALVQHQEQLQAYAHALSEQHANASVDAWIVALESSQWIQVLPRETGERP